MVEIRNHVVLTKFHVRSISNAYCIFHLQYVAIHGFVTCWVEPVQSTLDHLIYGCRLGFDYGNFSAAMNNGKVKKCNILMLKNFTI